MLISNNIASQPSSAPPTVDENKAGSGAFSNILSKQVLKNSKPTQDSSRAVNGHKQANVKSRPASDKIDKPEIPNDISSFPALDAIASPTKELGVSERSDDEIATGTDAATQMLTMLGQPAPPVVPDQFTLPSRPTETQDGTAPQSTLDLTTGKLMPTTSAAHQREYERAAISSGNGKIEQQSETNFVPPRTEPTTLQAHASLSGFDTYSQRNKSDKQTDGFAALMQHTSVREISGITPIQTPSPITGAASPLPQGIGNDQWNYQVAQHVRWQIDSQQSSATITLNPPELGPLQIVVQIDGGQANTSFGTDNPDARRALEESMSKLREAMSEAGINLGEASVGSFNGSAQQERQHQADAWQSRSSEPSSGPVRDATAALPAAAEIVTTVRIRNGLVDTYA